MINYNKILKKHRFLKINFKIKNHIQKTRKKQQHKTKLQVIEYKDV